MRKSSAVVEYERSIQTAFREVADAPAGRETFSRQIDAQTVVVKSAERRTDLVNLRYRAGIEDRLNCSTRSASRTPRARRCWICATPNWATRSRSTRRSVAG